MGVQEEDQMGQDDAGQADVVGRLRVGRARAADPVDHHGVQVVVHQRFVHHFLRRRNKKKGRRQDLAPSVATKAKAQNAEDRLTLIQFLCPLSRYPCVMKRTRRLGWMPLRLRLSRSPRITFYTRTQQRKKNPVKKKLGTFPFRHVVMMQSFIRELRLGWASLGDGTLSDGCDWLVLLALKVKDAGRAPPLVSPLASSESVDDDDWDGIGNEAAVGCLKRIDCRGRIPQLTS